jgi:hypothetical protein
LAFGAACALGFAVTYLVALHSSKGVRLDLELYRRASGNASQPVKAVGERALRTIDIGSIGVALLGVVAAALVRRRLVRAAASVAVVVLSVGTAEALKHGLPHVPHGVPVGRGWSFPSGHSSIAVSLGLALVVAVPSVLRPSAAVFGAAYAAGIGLSLVVLGWHYPSDVIGSFFICGFWACVILALLSGNESRRSLHFVGLVLACVVVAGALLVAAVIASRHPGAVAEARSSRSVVGLAALLGSLSLALFGALTLLVAEPSD